MQTAHAITESSSGATNQLGVVIQLLKHGVEDGVFPGATLVIGQNGHPIVTQAFGTKSVEIEDGKIPSPMGIDTVFDIAALTNVLVTTTLIMKLYENGKLQLEDRVSRYIQGFGVHGKSSITIAHLLCHSSGLASWVPFYEELVKLNSGSRVGVLTSRGAKEYVYNAINRSHLKYQPGTRQLFSDVGLIVLGHIIEVLTGLSLDKAAQRLIFQPLGLKSTSYVDLSMIKRRGIHPITDVIAPTEACPWRKRVLCGEVHDDNAWAMGGIAGHSGVFSTAMDLHVFAWEMLAAARGGSNFLRRDTVLQFWSKPAGPFDPSWVFGWELPNRENSLLDVGFSENAVGHCGFTGCSLWLEPEKGVDVILMSNRVNPSRSNKKIFSFRAELHRAILRALNEL